MKTQFKMLPKFLLGAAFIAAPQLAFAAGGDLDTTFSTDGKTTVSFNNQDYAYAMAVQSDKKVIVVGRSLNGTNSYDVAVTRLNTNGSLDTTFNGTGKLLIDYGVSSPTIDSGEAVTIQADGKILIAGDTGSSLTIARVNSNGTLDTSFNSTGRRVLTRPSGYAHRAEAIALQSDGKILIGGSYTYDSTQPNAIEGPLVARLNSDSSLDTSFGSGGYDHLSTPTAPYDTSDVEVQGLAVQGDGKIVYVGSVIGGTSTHFIGRLNTGGTSDTTFSPGSLGSAFAQTSFYALALQSDGKIVAVGSCVAPSSTNSNFLAVRYNTNGSLDTGFSDDGYRTLDFGGTGEAAYGVVVQPNGKINVGGSSNAGSGGLDYALTRFNANGSLDTTFTTDGTDRVLTDLGGSDNCAGIGRDSDGKLVLAGYAFDSTTSTSVFAISRYNGSYTPPALKVKSNSAESF